MMSTNNHHWPSQNAPVNDDDDDDDNNNAILITTTKTTTTRKRPTSNHVDKVNNVIVEFDTSTSTASDDNNNNLKTLASQALHYRQKQALPTPTTINESVQNSLTRVAPTSDDAFARIVVHNNSSNIIAPKRRTKLKKQHAVVDAVDKTRLQQKHNNNTLVDTTRRSNAVVVVEAENVKNSSSSSNKQQQQPYHYKHERLVPVSASTMTTTTTQPRNTQPAQQQQQQQQRQSLWERTKKLPIESTSNNNERNAAAAVIVAPPDNSNNNHIAKPVAASYEYECIEVQKRKRSPMQLKSERETRKRNFEWRRRIKTRQQQQKQSEDNKKNGARHHSLDHLSAAFSASSSSSSVLSSSSGDETHNTAAAAARFLAERQRARSRSPAARRRRAVTRSPAGGAGTVNSNSRTPSNSATTRSASLLSVRDMPSSSGLLLNVEQSFEDIFGDLQNTVDKSQSVVLNKPQNRRRHRHSPIDVELGTAAAAEAINTVALSDSAHKPQVVPAFLAASSERLRLRDYELERQLEELQNLQQFGAAVPAIIVSKPDGTERLQKFPVDSEQQANQAVLLVETIFGKPELLHSEKATSATSTFSPVLPPNLSTSPLVPRTVKRFIPVPPAKSGVLMFLPPNQPSEKVQIIGGQAFHKSPSPSPNAQQMDNKQLNTSYTHSTSSKQHKNDDEWRRQSTIPTPSSSSNAGSIIITTTTKSSSSPQPQTATTFSSQPQPRPTTTSSRLMSMSITGPTPIFTIQPNLQWNLPVSEDELNRRRLSGASSLEGHEAENLSEDKRAVSPSSVNFMRKFFERFTPNIKNLGGISHESRAPHQQDTKVPTNRSPASSPIRALQKSTPENFRLGNSPPPPTSPSPENNLLRQSFSPSPPASSLASIIMQHQELPKSVLQTNNNTPLSGVEPLRVKQINKAQFFRIPTSPTHHHQQRQQSASPAKIMMMMPRSESKRSLPILPALSPASDEQSPSLPDLPPNTLDLTNFNSQRDHELSSSSMPVERPNRLQLEYITHNQNPAQHQSPVPDLIRFVASSNTAPNNTTFKPTSPASPKAFRIQPTSRNFALPAGIGPPISMHTIDVSDIYPQSGVYRPAISGEKQPFVRSDSLQQKFNELDDLCQSIALQQHQHPISSSSSVYNPLLTSTPHAYSAPTTTTPTRNIAHIVRAFNKQSTVPMNIITNNTNNNRNSAGSSHRSQSSTRSVIKPPLSSAGSAARPVSADFSPSTPYGENVVCAPPHRDVIKPPAMFERPLNTATPATPAAGVDAYSNYNNNKLTTNNTHSPAARISFNSNNAVLFSKTNGAVSSTPLSQKGLEIINSPPLPLQSVQPVFSHYQLLPENVAAHAATTTPSSFSRPNGFIVNGTNNNNCSSNNIQDAADDFHTHKAWPISIDSNNNSTPPFAWNNSTIVSGLLPHEDEHYVQQHGASQPYNTSGVRGASHTNSSAILATPVITVNSLSTSHHNHHAPATLLPSNTTTSSSYNGEPDVIKDDAYARRIRRSNPAPSPSSTNIAMPSYMLMSHAYTPTIWTGDAKEFGLHYPAATSDERIHEIKPASSTHIRSRHQQQHGSSAATTPTAGTTMRVTFPRVEPHVEFDDSFTRWLVQAQGKPSSGTVQRIINGAVPSTVGIVNRHEQSRQQRQKQNLSAPAVHNTMENNSAHYPTPQNFTSNATTRIAAPSSGVTITPRRTRPVSLAMKRDDYSSSELKSSFSSPTPHYSIRPVPNTPTAVTNNNFRRAAVLEADVSLVNNRPVFSAASAWKHATPTTTYAASPTPRATSLVTLASPTTAHYGYPVYSVRDTGETTSVSPYYRSAMKPSPSYPIEYRSKLALPATTTAAHLSGTYYRPVTTTSRATLTPTSSAEPLYQRLSDFKSSPRHSARAAGVTSYSASPTAFSQPSTGANSPYRPMPTLSNSYNNKSPSITTFKPSYSAAGRTYSTNYSSSTSHRAPFSLLPSPPPASVLSTAQYPPSPRKFGAIPAKRFEPLVYGAVSRNSGAPSNYSTPYTTWTTPTSRQFATLL